MDATSHGVKLVRRFRATKQSPWIITAGEAGVDEMEADEAAVHGHRSDDQPVSGAEDSRLCAGRASHVAGLGKVVPSQGR